MYYTKIIITINGESAHGSTPHLSKDAIVAASSFILNAQTIVSRMNNPLYPLTFTVSEVNGGTQFNIITDFVKIIAYLYAENPQMIKEIQNKLVTVAECSANAFGCIAKLEFNNIKSE